jgi:PEP-CTERM motif
MITATKNVISAIVAGFGFSRRLKVSAARMPTQNMRGDRRVLSIASGHWHALLMTFGAPFIGASLLIPGVASATLIDRGGGLIYDTVLDITWVQDANLCLSLGNCVNSTTGEMTWADANTWAANLVYGGFDDWRLPWGSVAAGAGPVALIAACQSATEVQCRDNEMGYMYYYNLGAAQFDDLTGTQTAVSGVVLNNIHDDEWSGTADLAGFSWAFSFISGNQLFWDTSLAKWTAWAVRDGDVGAVRRAPEPATLALLGVALACLGFSRRRKLH